MNLTFWFFAAAAVSVIVYMYADWVQRHNARIARIVEAKKAASELCRGCPEYKKCYALCYRYRLWEAGKSTKTR